MDSILNNNNLLCGQILPCGSFTRVGNDMTWPSYDQGELEWQLRHGSEQQVVEARMKLAAIVGAYKAMLELPQRKRNAICKAIREATK